MNKVDTEYFRIVNDILTNGKLKKNRTGVDTIGIFGAQAKYNVDLNAFPLLTTKKVHWPAIVHELLWFISGSTNIKYLVDNNIRIWNEWAYKKYKDTRLSKIPNNELAEFLHHWEHKTQDEFVERIKEDAEFAKKWGELGEGTYGGMWRAFPYFDNSGPMCHNPITPDPTAPLDIHYETSGGYSCEVGHVDQLQKVINKLKTNPDDRRMIVSAWHPYWVDQCALPPCHCLFQFHTEELTQDERFDLYRESGGNKGWVSVPEMNEKVLNDANIPTRRLNCLLYQRSQDTALGNPFNVASYSLLTAMIAQSVNMTTGTFTHSTGDTHIYVNHIDGLKLQLTREPKKLPRVWLNPEVKSLFDFKYDDIKLLDYEFHPTIKFDVAV